MDLEKLSAILTKYQYKNKLGNQKVYVKLGFSQSVEVVPKENEKVLIADKLEFWNPLTGAIEMSLKKAMISNSAAILLTCIVVILARANSLKTSDVLVLSCFLVWILTWTVYYLIRLENFKRLIMDLMEKALE